MPWSQVRPQCDRALQCYHYHEHIFVVFELLVVIIFIHKYLCAALLTLFSQHIILLCCELYHTFAGNLTNLAPKPRSANEENQTESRIRKKKCRRNNNKKSGKEEGNNNNDADVVKAHNIIISSSLPCVKWL